MLFNDALKVILQHEGGYVNHPKDPGGMTNLGVTKRVYEEWVGHTVNESVMRSLKPANVAPIYKKNYWDKVKCSKLPSGLDLCVFDSAVNSGPTRAAKWLQHTVGAKEDGVIGPKTLAAINTLDTADVINNYMDTRLKFLKSLSIWPTFGKGWGRRVEETRNLALEANRKLA